MYYNNNIIADDTIKKQVVYNIFSWDTTNVFCI